MREKYVFELFKENVELAKAEVLALIDKQSELVSDLLLIDADGKQEYSRLAFTKRIHKLLLTTNTNDFEKEVKAFDWKAIYEDSIGVRKDDPNTSLPSEKSLGSLIITKLIENKIDWKVDLKNPRTDIHFFVRDNTVYITQCIHTTEKSYLQRKAHMRPKLYPTSLHPKLARAAINLTGVKDNATVLDPFCGSGGILIEAGKLGFGTIGFDLDKKTLFAAKENLAYYDIDPKNLYIQDATKLTEFFAEHNELKPTTIVTDLPYGRASKLHDQEINALYTAFFKELYQFAKERGIKRMCVMLPDFADLNVLDKFKIIHQFSWPLTKTLTKKILILSN